ncbi:hypothetical protein [Streptomyces sp. AP-93]|uniref:hypothetical protein n=1 Tax=Streptomyces sp. AP-93 TaxID=2929048 RepID=UPI001FAF1ABE|nr:hypothetical protein [Streptomyces sp. AP-93]MCJ0870290.1 hypothetical protein [Streptomyces sp. AP-93]
MTIRTIDFRACPCGSKRAYPDPRAAERALGKAQAKRRGVAERRGTGRGITFENRYYECEHGMYHLTSLSRAEYSGVAA